MLYYSQYSLIFFHEYIYIYIYINNFVSDVKDLTETFVRQGFDFVRLRDRYFIFCSKYLYRWAKFGTDIASSKVVHKIFPYKIS